ncbi:MAG: DMT family transporter [Lautropia sp.]|nr:DMT family transporter [Lautropia sp.]
MATDEQARHDERLGLIYGVLGAMLFAGKGILIKLAYRHGVDTESFLGLRMLWSAPLFVAVIWWADGERMRAWWRQRGRASGLPAASEPLVGQPMAVERGAVAGQMPGQSSTPARVHHAGSGAGVASTGAGCSALQTASPWRAGDAWKVFGLGFSGYYLASYLDFLGLQYISVGLERVLLYLGPTFVLLISVFWLKRPVSRLQWLALAVSYLGVILVYLHDLDMAGQQNVPLGSLLVLGSCLSYAFYLLGSGELVGRLGPRRLTAWASLVASVLCVVQALVLGGLTMFQQSWAVQGIAILTAIFCTVMPLFLTMAAVDRLGAGKAAQVGMIGPVWTIFLGAMILGEPVGGLQLVGTAVVIAGVLILGKAGRKK